MKALFTLFSQICGLAGRKSAGDFAEQWCSLVAAGTAVRFQNREQDQVCFSSTQQSFTYEHVHCPKIEMQQGLLILIYSNPVENKQRVSDGEKIHCVTH